MLNILHGGGEGGTVVSFHKMGTSLVYVNEVFQPIQKWTILHI